MTASMILDHECDYQWHPQSDDFGVCSACGAEAPDDDAACASVNSQPPEEA